jgi:hypothetical protein
MGASAGEQDRARNASCSRDGNWERLRKGLSCWKKNSKGLAARLQKIKVCWVVRVVLSVGLKEGTGWATRLGWLELFFLALIFFKFIFLLQTFVK